MKKVAIEFTEGRVTDEQRELTEAEAQKFGVKLSEINAADLDKIRKSITESYLALGLSEPEAKLAADLDLNRQLY